jgi:hypothetical protein
MLAQKTKRSEIEMFWEEEKEDIFKSKNDTYFDENSSSCHLFARHTVQDRTTHCRSRSRLQKIQWGSVL